MVCSFRTIGQATHHRPASGCEVPVVDRPTRNSWVASCRPACAWLASAWLLGAAAPAQAEVVTGTYDGDGLASHAIDGLGFEPVVVIVKGDHAAPAVIRTSSMPAGTSKALAGDQAPFTDGILGFTADGFTVGDGAAVNSDGVKFSWVAFSSDPGRLRIGSYVGSGLARALPLPGFETSAVLLVPASSRRPHWASVALPAGESCAFDDEAARSGLITGLTADGFTVGADTDVNQLLNVYHYVAWAVDDSRIAHGSYVGNGTNGQDIAGLPLEPEWLLVKSRDALPGMQKPRALGSNKSGPFTPEAYTASAIKQLTDDGFRLGGDYRANEAGRTYYYLAVAAASSRSSDLQVGVEAGASIVAEGDTVDVVVSVGNTGPDEAQGVQVAVSLPSGLEPLGVAAGEVDWEPATGIWTAGDIAVGGSVSLPIRARVAEGTSGQALAVTAGIANLVGVDPVPANDSAQVQVTVGTADLELRLVTSDVAPDPGEQLQVDVELENHGPLATGGVTVALDWPAGLSFNGATAEIGSYNPATRVWTVGSLVPGQIARMTLTCRANVNAVGELLTLSAVIATSEVTDPDPANDAAHVDLRVSGAASDLGLTLDVDDATPDVGQTVGLTVTATNFGPSADSDIVIEAILPAGLAYAGHAAGAGSFDAGSGRWTLAGLADGESAALTIQAIVAPGTAGTQLTVTASVVGTTLPDPEPANDSATVAVTVTSADLSVRIEASDVAPAPGAPVDLVVTLRNGGPDAATAAGVDLVLPVELTLTSATPATGTYDAGNGRWQVPALASGATTTLAVSTTADGLVPGTDVQITADVATSAQGDPVPANNRDSVTIGSRSADVALNLVADDVTPDAGQVVGFTATVANGGPDAATGIGVAIVLDAGLGLSGFVPSQGLFDAASGAWAVGDLAAGSTATLVLGAGVAAGTAGRGLSVGATIVSVGTGDPVPANDSSVATVTVTSVDLALSLVADPSPADELGPVSVTVTLANLGPDRATGIAVVAPVPAGLVLQGHVAGAGSFDADTGLWEPGALDGGQTATLELSALVEAGRGGTLLPLVATVVDADQEDPAPANDAAALDLRITSADLAVSMDVSDATPDQAQVITYHVALVNGGPDVATGARAQVTLPAGVSYVGHVAGAGTYSEATGTWQAGDLPVAAGATLDIDVRVAAGAAGDILLAEALARGNQSDPEPANNLAQVTAAVTAADLYVTLGASDRTPGEGQQITLAVVLGNHGPAEATAVAVSVVLPAGLSYVSSATSAGSYDAGAGTWNVPALGAGGSVLLQVTVLVQGGTGGEALPVTASIADRTQGDPVAANDTAGVDVFVQVPAPKADVALLAAFAPESVAAGDTTSLVLRLANAGPDASSGIEVRILLPDALSVASYAAQEGTFATDTLYWRPADLAPGATDSLALRCAVSPSAGEAILAAEANIEATDVADPDGANDAVSATLTVVPRPVVRVLPRPFAEVQRRLLPGGPLEDVLRFDVVNDTGVELPLSTLTFTNPVVGAGTQDRHDAAWAPLGLVYRRDGERQPVRIAGGAPAAATFGSGVAGFTDLDLRIAPGDTLHLILRGGARLGASDGLVLRPYLAGPGALALGAGVVADGTWPLVPGGTLSVDGMTAAQITLHPVEALVFQLGSTRNPALDVTLPANGDQADQLTRLNVRNLGTAGPEILTRVEAWADDGDGDFNAAADHRLGSLYWTGDRWEVTGLSRPVPLGGLRVMITVDVAAAALGGTIRLGLPAGDDTGVGMASGNDGPVDQEVANPYAQAVSATDRVIVSAVQMPSGVLAPAQANVPLLHLAARNLYSGGRTLDHLRIYSRCTVKAGAPAGQRDLLVSQLHVRADGNGDGVLGSLDVDPLLGSAVFEDGVATFDGLRWSLAPGALTHLFVTGSLSLSAAADGDTIAAVVGGAADLGFDGTVALVGDWPLDSGARHHVDGMTSLQLANREIPAISLAPGDGPALALDLTVPGNGYATDVLSQLRLVNRGSARSGDIAGMQLWADDGDGSFTPGSDQLLGALAGVDSVWVAPTLDVSIPPGGLRLFTSLDVTATPADSVTVRLSVPVDGVTVVSANDGPRDASSVGPTMLLISTAPLLTDLRVSPARSTVGQAVQVMMTVTNVSGEGVDAIAPTGLAFAGEGDVVVIGGPYPATLDLASGAQGTFTWDCTATATGKVRASGGASGTGVVGSQVRRSLESISSSHEILAPALGLGIYPVANMPVSVNRGQTNIVPLNLTLVNDGGAETAEIRLAGLVVTLDDGDGHPLVPSSVLSRVTVNEGFDVYASRTDLETSGQSVTLAFTPAVIVTTREPVTIGLRLDVRPDASAPAFRVLLAAATDFSATDNVSGSPVPIDILSGSLPFSTGTCRLVAQATGLAVGSSASAATSAGAGQENVELLRLELRSDGDPAFPSNVQVASFRVSIVDTLGRRLPDPHAHVAQLRVTGPMAVHAVANVDDAGDSTVAFTLLPSVIVPVGNQPTVLGVLGRIPADARLGAFRLRLEAASAFDARDGNVGAPVAVVYNLPYIQGPVVTVQAPVAHVTMAGAALFGERLVLGARDVAAMSLQLSHGGDALEGAAIVDTLRLRCVDNLRRPLDPAAACDRLRVTWRGAVCADVAPTTSPGGMVAVPLTGVRLDAGSTGELRVVVDLESQIPAAGFEVTLAAADVVARDANLSTPVSVLAADGRTSPYSSGLTYFLTLSDELQVAMLDRMPALLAGDGSQVVVAALNLHNPAATTAGGLVLRSVTLRARGADGAVRPLGADCIGLVATVGDSTWATAPAPAPTDTTIVLSGSAPLAIAAGETATLAILARFRDGSSGGLRIGIAEGDVEVGQASGATGSIRVRPAAGAAFPFWTATGHFSGQDLEASFINFPNPFAAGRQETRLAFALAMDAEVTVRIIDARGEDVTVLCGGCALAAGLHQDLTWDGTNGRGDTVRNGVYLAELTVRYADGSRARLLRKVAVVR